MFKKIGLVAVMVAAMVVVFTSCASGPASLDQAMQNMEVLDYKGATTGSGYPDWMLAWDDGGNTAVDKLDAYKGNTCFVIESTNSSKDFATNWVKGT
jgi:hypothetical protein